MNAAATRRELMATRRRYWRTSTIEKPPREEARAANGRAAARALRWGFEARPRARRRCDRTERRR